MGDLTAALKRFAYQVLRVALDGNSMEGDEVQDLGVECGLLRPEHRDTPCVEGCACEEMDNIPGTCYRLRPELLDGK